MSFNFKTIDVEFNECVERLTSTCQKDIDVSYFKDEIIDFITSLREDIDMCKIIISTFLSIYISRSGYFLDY